MINKDSINPLMAIKKLQKKNQMHIKKHKDKIEKVDNIDIEKKPKVKKDNDKKESLKKEYIKKDSYKKEYSKKEDIDKKIEKKEVLDKIADKNNTHKNQNYRKYNNYKKNYSKNYNNKFKNKKTEHNQNLVYSLEKQVVDIITDNKNTKVKYKNKKNKLNSSSKVKIIPLGGLEQIGMNITAFEYEDSIFVVDCGLAFPSEDMLGIDLVIPNISYLKDNYQKVKGFVITHGHEDHIGALPYILKQLNVPVYGTKLTIALIEKKLKEHNIDKKCKLNVVKYGQSAKFGDMEVEFIKTNHSIADACALAIFTPAGIIFHTGDFKIDYTPLFGEAADLQRMAEIGKKGCLALLCDSTNATKPGFTMSEVNVGKTFDNIFSENKNSRIIVATFASNVDRVQQIINTAYQYGRKVVVEGRSMVNIIGIASDLGYINIPKGTLVETEQLKNYPLEKTVIITTGSQGESMAALSRMASSTHRKLSIHPSDVVIMSSTPIPGNEKAVSRVINELAMKGANVILQDTHVSGHACQEEIKLMYSLLKPKYSLPVHGEFRHRIAQGELAKAVGVAKENVLIMQSGDVVEICNDSCKVVGKVEAGGVYVDGLGVGDVGNVVLKDRQNLAQNGIIIITLVLEKGSNQILSGPDIISRGFVYVKESEDLLEEAKVVVEKGLAKCLDSNYRDWSKMKTLMRDSLNDFLWKKMKRNPVILPVIMEV